MQVLNPDLHPLSDEDPSELLGRSPGRLLVEAPAGVSELLFDQRESSGRPATNTTTETKISENGLT